MDYRFKIFKGVDLLWYITIEHANGQALYASEGYVRKESALDTLENFLRAVRSADATVTELIARHSVRGTDFES